MSARKLLFWIHLTCGVVAGAVVLIMSVTGVLLTYQRQIIAWCDTHHRRREPPVCRWRRSWRASARSYGRHADDREAAG
jgi:uncharacterized iron-regulated membrane protein